MKLVNVDAFIKEYSDNPANIIFTGKRNGKAFEAGRAAERSVLLEALSKFQTIDLYCPECGAKMRGDDA